MILRTLLLCLLSVWLAVPAYGQTELDWLAVGYEDQPTNTDPVPEGDDRIRDARVNVRVRAETELCWGDQDATGCGGTGQDSGRLREGAARIFFDGTAPTVLEATDNNIGGAGSDALDSGRVWTDSDNNRVWVYDSAWESAVAGSNYNLIYNGSFEATDGDGDPASIVEPEGWTALGTPATFTYVDPSGDTNSADGYHVVVAAVAGAGADGMTQSMLLPPNTTFWAQARVNNDGVDTCRMDTTGATTDMVDQDYTAAAWGTVSATFATGAVAETVVFRLISVNAGDICEWDSVQVYAMNDVPRHTQRFRAEYQTEQDCDFQVWTGPCSAATTGLSVIVTPPAPGYIAEISASINAEGDNSFACFWRIYDGATALDTVTLESASTDRHEISLSLRATDLNPTPGTPITYRIDGWEQTADCQLENTHISWIEVLLRPN